MKCLIFIFIFLSSHLALAAKAPNVIFLLADDQRAGTLNLADKGNPQIKTPNLDALAARGFLFDNAYVFGSGQTSVCYPSRTQILSGKVLYRSKTLDIPSKNRNDMSLPLAFRLAGYQTIRTGKANNVPYAINNEFDLNIERANRGAVKGNIGYFQDAKDFLNKKTLTGLKGNKFKWDGKSPFFMYLAVGTPHGPFPHDAQAAKQYDTKKISPPADSLIAHKTLLSLAPKLKTELKSQKDVNENLKKYYASITFMDRLLGELNDELKRKGLFENTIIIFASDNGLSIGSHGVRQKSNVFEFGGLHVPMLFAGPGIKQGRSQSLSYLHDIYPTLSELTGIDKPKALDGKSLLPVIQGKQNKIREYIYTTITQKGMQQRAVRDHEWKLIYFPAVNSYELYNLYKDPRELKNLAANKKFSKILARMKEELEKQGAKWGDKFQKTGFSLKRTYRKKNFPPEIDLGKF